jgi:hypothetical protein
MPVRIRPVHDLGPCTLTLEQIQKISELVEQNFPSVTYSAYDGVWEIYDEPKDPFLLAISQRETLDSLGIKGSGDPSKEVAIVFNEKEAKVDCTARPEDENWFEHFLFDLRKFIGPPTVRQLTAYLYKDSDAFAPYLAHTSVLFGIPIRINTSAIIATPYCRIVIRQKPPSQLVENIKANLISNIIWVVIVFVSGALFALFLQWIR